MKEPSEAHSTSGYTPRLLKSSIATLNRLPSEQLHEIPVDVNVIEHGESSPSVVSDETPCDAMSYVILNVTGVSGVSPEISRGPDAKTAPSAPISLPSLFSTQIIPSADKAE